MKLIFDDGVSIETAGPLRKLSLKDGWYVVGGGFCIPVESETEADEVVDEMTESEQTRDTVEKRRFQT